MYYVTGTSFVIGASGKPVKERFRVRAGSDLDEVYKTLVVCHRDGDIDLAIVTPDGSLMTEQQVLDALRQRREGKNA